MKKNNANPPATQWINLALQPAGAASPSLAPALLMALMNDGLIKTEHLLEPSPLKLAGNDLEYSWFDEYGERQLSNIIMPVWAHWLIKQERDFKKASEVLLEKIDPYRWITPLWKEFRGIDVLMSEDDHVGLDTLLGKLDPHSLHQLRKQTPDANKNQLGIHYRVASPALLKVLLKHGWDPDQKDTNGNMAVDLTRDIKLFEALIEGGVDLVKARGRVPRIADTAKDKQRLIKLIDQKKIKLSGKQQAPWEADHNAVVAILESGVGGGFMAAMTQLHNNHPVAPPEGMTVLGGSIGWGMIQLALRLKKGGRLKTKTKAYFVIAEAILAHHGKGWVDLDAPITGPEKVEGLTNRDGVMMGAMMLMTHKWYDRHDFLPDEMPGVNGQLQTLLGHWIEHRLNDVILKAEDIKEDEVSVLPPLRMLGAMNAWGDNLKHYANTYYQDLNDGVLAWQHHLSQSNPLMRRVRDDAMFMGGRDLMSSRNTYQEIDELEISRKGQHLWPNFLAKIVSSLPDLNEQWHHQACQQWRLSMTHTLLHTGQISDASTLLDTLAWTTDMEHMVKDQAHWKAWVADLSTPIPVLKLKNDNVKFTQEEVLARAIQAEIVDSTEEVVRALYHDMPQEQWNKLKNLAVSPLNLLSGHREVDHDDDLALMKRVVLSIQTLQNTPDHERSEAPKIKM